MSGQAAEVLCPIKSQVLTLTTWYDEAVRPFLERMEKVDSTLNRVAEFDTDLVRLKRAAEAYDDNLVVGFLGVAGVGKSTLINALVDGRHSTLPHGGIGPLTAQALKVRRGSNPSFHVNYHGIAQVWKLLTALDWGFSAELQGKDPKSRASAKEQVPKDVELTENELIEIKESVTEGIDADRSRREFYRKQAQLLVKGKPDEITPLPYLIDCLRYAIEKKPVWGLTPENVDEKRIERLKKSIKDRTYTCVGSVSERNFREALADHATGFLAPLIVKMEVTCPSDSLPPRVELVDLPGVGVAGDPHKEVTIDWVRNQARSVILVVNHRGIQEADARLLQETEFLNRLVYSAESPEEDRVHLMVAVVQIDEIAASHYRSARAANDRSKSKKDYFDEACEKARNLVKDNLRSVLERVWCTGGLQPVQAQVIDNLLSSLVVHPVSAIEYGKILADDEDDRPFLTDASHSHIPDLLDTLRKQAEERYQTEVNRLDTLRKGFEDRLYTTLKLIEARWTEQNRAIEEAERLRADVRLFLGPLRDNYKNRQGAYREFLRETLPATIKAEVLKASLVASKEIDAYLKPLQDIGWRTLAATIQRGGTFVSGVGKQIDLPKEFATRFEVPVADAWAKCVLKEIRRRTKEFADDSVQLVEEVVVWAKQQGTRIQPRLVEAQRDSIKADVKELETVGKIMVDQLRQEVNARLVKKIETPIRRRCKSFVDSGKNQGTGVKYRILEEFAKLAKEVTESATGPAEEILLEAFKQVHEEILAVLKKHPHPLDAAGEAIVAAHEKYVERSDAQRRAQILADLENVFASQPGEKTTAKITSAA